MIADVANAFNTNMDNTWIKCGAGWCNLDSVNLDHHSLRDLTGVYVIWQGGGPVVRVGQGIIKDRLGVHKDDPEITAYRPLSVTWFDIPESQQDGVERYLADTLDPVIGDSFPDCSPIRVGLPWPWHN